VGYTAGMGSFVSYLRVSTTRQGESGLGIEAQRAAVARHVAGGCLLAEYLEVESGSKNVRPQLLAALAHAQATGATLIIAKLDRLARNVHFISGLMEAGIDFIAADLPSANRLTINVLAAVAEHEREMISARTKAALAAAKARGVRLGNPNGAPGPTHRRQRECRVARRDRGLGRNVAGARAADHRSDPRGRGDLAERYRPSARTAQHQDPARRSLARRDGPRVAEPDLTV
jgi:DNA invertase Pin-like site-specific DNA recombinase